VGLEELFPTWRPYMVGKLMLVSRWRFLTTWAFSEGCLGELMTSPRMCDSGDRKGEVTVSFVP
jgi:hypothetical protein